MMRDTCSNIEKIVDLWEESGEMEYESVRRIEDHLAECPECMRRYGSLLPFIIRDGDTLDRVYQQDTAAMARVENSVMDRILNISSEDDHSSAKGFIRERKKRYFPKALIAAAAAVVLVVGGFFIGFNVASTKTSGSKSVLVRFELAAPEAKSVQLVGDFTNWDQKGLELKDPDHDGVWVIEVRLQKGNTYTYNFVINGDHWIPDPSSTKQVEDGFGGSSTMLQL